MDPNTFFAIMAFFFGLAFGSFLNVCIYRMPRGLSVVSPRSACPQCKTPIAGYDNIPVLSWLILRGKCRHCGLAISPRYLGVELLTAVLFAACVLHFGANLFALKFCVFAFLVVGLIFTDCENRLLPDLLTLPGFGVGVVLAAALPMFGLFEYVYSDRLPWRVLSVGDALLGAIVGAGFVYIAGELYFRLRGIMGMGGGDVKLLLLIGAFLGARLALFTIFASALTAAVIGLAMLPAVWHRRTNAKSMVRRFPDAKVRRREAYDSAMRCLRLPYGSFLGIAALIAVFYGDQFFEFYFGRFFS